jgi:hypothetical protein
MMMMPVMVAPVVMMPVVPTVVAPVVVVPTVMPVPVMPADLFGLETIDFVLPDDGGLRACSARQHQAVIRRNRR